MEEKYYNVAYKEALKAYKKGEIPVGAVIVKGNKIIAKGHNNRQNNNNIFGHAEINAIIKAEKKLKDWRLDQCTLYVTLYPCKMCEMIIEESRIKNVYYLIENYNNKSNKFIQTKVCDNIKNNCQNLFDNFFKKLRK